MQVPLTMNVKRAAISLLLASFVPGLVAAFASRRHGRPDPLPEFMVGQFVWFLFSAPIVLVVGFATLWSSKKLRGGPIYVPPIVGGASGLIVAKTIYTHDANTNGIFLFISCGVATSLIAMLIYFWPRKAQPKSSQA